MGKLLESASDSGPPYRVALGIEYNGSCFNGWQRQKSREISTVQEALEIALSQVANHPVRLVCAGRTDAGVHGTGQVVHFEYQHERPQDAWVRGGNSNLPGSITVLWARQVPKEFHARFSAVSRRYRYIIYNNPVRPAILHGLVTPHYLPLDADLMHEAGQSLLGEHDFSSFRGAGCQSSTPMRNVHELSVNRKGDYVLIDIQANAFLLHMVRNIAGLLISIGHGDRPASWTKDVLELKDRTKAGITAVPDGLYLTQVNYPEKFGLPAGGEGPRFSLFQS